ncbi:acyl carrier protein [Actinoplanes siamensis]|uniref:Actinorhodin polyketide synthase acyl carrier protein n=1 Tax=Actinoplanes siamensis TaxID=1223317 RepID=A0A919N9M2_9ACTN|nr:acyl carrier protein [Actinoplanes siamensis]GIF07077.1 actinorhodin polyketide synthase acyl carrier protein [Actinoplanes siamensis]
MPKHITIDDLTEIMRSSIGLDDDVELTGDRSEMDFADMGYDSLALIELASQLQHRFGVKISDDEALERLRSPHTAVSYVNEQLAGQAV